MERRSFIKSAALLSMASVVPACWMKSNDKPKNAKNVYHFKKEPPSELLRGHLNLGGSNDNTTIEVNSHYLEKNNKCWIPVMGEIHYGRVKKEHWKEELLKMKAGGITIIATYVFWIFHEEEEGQFNFSGDCDLRHFLSVVKECDLDMVLRIGPWCHAEIRNGGFPDWLLEKGCATRTDDHDYLKYVTRYWRKLKEEVSGYLFDEGGPIVAIQLENELVNNATHIMTLKNLAIEIGLTAPIYTVTGWNRKYGAEIPEYDVLPVFGGYADAPWAQHTHQLEPISRYFFLPARNDHSIGDDLIVAPPETDENVFQMRYELYPFATCEIGPGVQVTHHRRPIITGDDAAALAMVKLGCGNNLPGYYMYHGGTNPIGKTHTMQESKATGYPNDVPVRSYDFQAPIGEFGQIRSNYNKLKIQHHFINSVGSLLGKMYPQFQAREVKGRYDTASLRYALRTNGESGYVFVNNHQRHYPLDSHDGVQFEVPVSNGTLIFPDGGMHIPSGSYFILPYNLDLDGITLSYATTQFLLKQDNTIFFMALNGIDAEYVWQDGRRSQVKPGLTPLTLETNGDLLQIVTLTQEQAEQLFVLEGGVFLARASLYRDGNTLTACRIGNNDLSWSYWDGTQFVEQEYILQPMTYNIYVTDAGTHFPDTLGSEEIDLSETTDIKSWDISTDYTKTENINDAMIRIAYMGDIAQIYVDGILAADDFYKGTPWEISLKHLQSYGEKITLVISNKERDNVYMENCSQRTGLELKDIVIESIYTLTNSIF
ncbi:beta-galactosidase [Vibrio mimicus]|uniref:beta-galactosidase n=1 Tax=Vibrio mimicus TaxID=674 RepID=UPI002F95A631